jgi:F0F1-type ATP synthase assembly protein I
MQANSGPGREIGEGYKYVALGATFAAGIVGFMAGGFALDRWLGLTPLFTLVGTVVGAVLSFLNVYYKLEAERIRRDELAGRKTGEGKS